jgi:hypothetical protein
MCLYFISFLNFLTSKVSVAGFNMQILNPTFLLEGKNLNIVMIDYSSI